MICLYVCMYLYVFSKYTCSQIAFDVRALHPYRINSVVDTFVSVFILLVQNHFLVYCACVKAIEMCSCDVDRSIVIDCVVFFHCEVIVVHAELRSNKRNHRI